MVGWARLQVWAHESPVEVITSATKPIGKLPLAL